MAVIVKVVYSRPLQSSSDTGVFVKGEVRFPGVTVRQAQSKEGRKGIRIID
jgi:hypothetical protein